MRLPLRTFSPLLRAIALVSTLGCTFFVGAARAEELRSEDEGVSITAPEGWTRCTKKLAATTALALERADAPEPHPRIVVNTLSIQNVTEERAFQIVRESLDRPGAVVERPTTGRFLRIDFDYDGGAGKLKDRVYTALRNKRVYCLMLETPAARFEEDLVAFEKVVDGVQFFAAAPKKPQTLPAPATAPIASPTDASSVRRADAKPARDSALASATESDTQVPAADKVSPAKPADTKPADTKPADAKPADAKPADAKFADAKPADAKPADTKPADTKPADAKLADAKPADAKPAETKPAAQPPAKPALVRRPGKSNVLTPASLAAFDDEYDPEMWTAKHLVDPSAKNGWCSSPSTHLPHHFVLDLGQPADIARLAFDDACSEDGGFEGSAAKEISVEGSTGGPDGPWSDLGHVTLEAGKNDQPVDLAPNSGRWLRVSIRSNHGHPVLTQLGRIRAFAAEVTPQEPSAPPPVTTDEGPFRLERCRISLENRGAALDPVVVDAGQPLWVYFKPRALQLSAAGEYSLEVDLRFEDAKGDEKLSHLKVVDHKGKPPAPPLSTFVSLKVELPASFPPGVYTLRIVARDREAKKEAQERIALEVRKPQ